MHSKGISSPLLIALVLATCASNACSQGLAVVSPEEAAKRLDLDPRVYGAFIEGVRFADMKADPLQRCLAFPPMPMNRWPAGLAESHCALAFGSGITAKHLGELLDAGQLKELEAIYAADQARHFSRTHFSEAIHGDFYFFDGGTESDRLSGQWLKKAPKSPYAMMARGNHLLNAARRVRRARAESVMTEAEIGQMRQLGQQSAELFAAAAAKAPNMIEAYNGLAHVGTIASLPEAEARGIEDGRKVDPLCAVLAVQEMWALTPRWGGSWQAMHARADELSDSLEQRPLVSLAIVMPTVDEASELCCSASDPNWRNSMGDKLRPLAMVTTSPDVSEYLGTSSWGAAGRPPLEGTMHLLLASRFRRGTTHFALQRARALMRNYYYHPEMALPDLQYVLDWEPDNAEAHAELGLVYFAQKRYPEAEKELLLGLNDHDARAGALFTLAQLLAKSGRIDEAHARAEEYHREFPAYEQQWAWLQDFLAKPPTAR